MDIVITYVDGLDPQWQKDYSTFVGGQALEKRFRDWGTLRYLLRGVQTHMPFIRNVYLVVSSDSQVPQWVNRENLKIVLHSDIIPAQYLPVFNSTAIEMFLHCIPGLDEEYIYFNDDIFPVKDCIPTQFFEEGKAVASPSREIFALNMYKKHARRSSNLARKAAGLAPARCYMRPQHCCSPMLKSSCEAVSEALSSEIAASITSLRDPRNINQYLFTDYMFYTGKTVARRMSCKHFSLAVASAEKIAAYIAAPERSFACINDVKLSDEKYQATRKTLLDAFENKFPEKSRFEL